MPTSAYRDWIGVAKISSTGTLTEAYASGVTSVVINSLGTTPTDSMSVVFLDGYDTETRAITAVTGTGPYTLTVAATTNAHPVNGFVFLQTTTALGPAAYIPMKTFTVPDKIPQIYDMSYTGNMSLKRSVAQAIRTAEWGFGGDMYADTIGYILKGLFGSEDFTSGTPNIHDFAIANTNSNAVGEFGQPDYYAFYVFDVVNTHVVVGKITEVGLKMDPKQNTSYTGKLLARAAGAVANPTTSYSSVVPIPGWRYALTLNSTGYRTPLTAEYTFTRNQSEAIPTMQGNQDPYSIFVGDLEAGAKYTFVKEDDSIRNLFQEGTIFPTSLAAVQGSGSGEIGLTVQMTDCNIDDDEDKLQGKSYNTEDVSFSGLINSTDATTAGGGESPCKLILSNNVATGVY